jgi:hypothetical protein
VLKQRGENDGCKREKANTTSREKIFFCFYGILLILNQLRILNILVCNN